MNLFFNPLSDVVGRTSSTLRNKTPKLRAQAESNILRTNKAEVSTCIGKKTANVFSTDISAKPKTGNSLSSSLLLSTCESCPSPYADRLDQVVSLEVCNMNYTNGAGSPKALLFSPLQEAV